MASFKQVTLKDPVTGEYLSPRVYGALEYEVVEDGEVTPPYDMDADTLQGHPASDFLLKTEYTPVDLSEYLKTATADTKYAAVDHNHNGVYAPASHTHTTANITGLDSKLSGYDTEIASLKSSVSNGKSAVASAITDKGVSTSATAPFDTMAANIRKIETGSLVAYKDITTADGIISVQYEDDLSGLADVGEKVMTIRFSDKFKGKILKSLSFIILCQYLRGVGWTSGSCAAYCSDSPTEYMYEAITDEHARLDKHEGGLYYRKSDAVFQYTRFAYNAESPMYDDYRIIVYSVFAAFE